MAYRSLADYLEDLADAGELVRVRVDVDPVMEIAEITERTARSGGPALLFERVRGHDTAVVTNLFGSPARICRAVGVETFAALPEWSAQRTTESGDQRWTDKLTLPRPRRAADRFRPRRVKAGPCQQVVRRGRDVDLNQLPALQSWPEETQRTITAGLAITTDPASGVLCADRCLLPILDDRSLHIVWDRHSATHHNWEAARRDDDGTPIAVVLGGDPLAMLMGDLPALAPLDRLALVGALRGEPLELVGCCTHEVRVPAAAELVIEGHVKPELVPARTETLVVAAPTGFYHESRRLPLIEVSAVTQRSNCLFPATVCGRPPSELTVIQGFTERLLLPQIQGVVPEVVDVGLPGFGPRGRFAFVAVRKCYAHQARKVASAIWGLSPTMLTKTIVVVDEGVDVHDVDDVMFHAGANVDAGRDVFFHDGPADRFDHAVAVAAGGLPTTGRKMGIDATAKLPEERPGPWPCRATIPQEVRALVDARWSQYGLG